MFSDVDIGPVMNKFLLLAAFILLALLGLSIIGITVAVATIFGGGVSLYNYVQAFKHNVRPEIV